MNHGRNESYITCFRCGKPGQMIGKCTMGNKTQQEYLSFNPQHAQNWQEKKYQDWIQNTQQKVVNMTTLKGKKGRILDIQSDGNKSIIDAG